MRARVYLRLPSALLPRRGGTTAHTLLPPARSTWHDAGAACATWLLDTSIRYPGLFCAFAARYHVLPCVNNVSGAASPTRRRLASPPQRATVGAASRQQQNRYSAATAIPVRKFSRSYDSQLSLAYFGLDVNNLCCLRGTGIYPLPDALADGRFNITAGNACAIYALLPSAPRTRYRTIAAHSRLRTPSAAPAPSSKLFHHPPCTTPCPTRASAHHRLRTRITGAAAPHATPLSHTCHAYHAATRLHRTSYTARDSSSRRTARHSARFSCRAAPYRLARGGTALCRTHTHTHRCTAPLRAPAGQHQAEPTRFLPCRQHGRADQHYRGRGLRT